MSETPLNNPLQPNGFGLWAVLRRSKTNDTTPTKDVVEELEKAVIDAEKKGVTIRGFYDASGFRADADLLIWLYGPIPEDLQMALRELKRTELLRPLLPTWNAVGVHRAAEFNKAHIPAFLRGVEPKQWLTIYPFVRSYEWYLLPEEERSRMLAEHGRKGAAFRSVLANTVASFGLSDYEWLLPLEADELTDLVDLMRELRNTDARRHVREETPFFTGRRITVAEIPEILR